MLKSDLKDNASSQNSNKANLNNELKNAATTICLTSLPIDILYSIFKICPLKEQLNVIKVCKLLRQIIQDIFKQNYKFYTYNYLILKCEHLTDAEISELCFQIGETVERLRFNTVINKDLIEYVNWSGISTITLEDYKNCIHNSFKQNLKYFTNLQEFEVQGNLLQDDIILVLSKNCKDLKTIRLLDTNNVYVKGEYLSKLKAIENLELKSCENLDYNFVLKVSKKRKLKILNIMKCDHLEDVNRVMNLCKHWQYLETLRLTAFSTDPRLLKAIMNLSSLKTLQFLALAAMPENFEELLFQQLKVHKTKSLLLKQIKFENNNYNLDCEAVEYMPPKRYAEKLESVVVNNRPWQLSKESFVKFSQKFENFKNLKTLELRYCRIFNYQQLKRLCVINQKLELIKIYGCPMEVDDLLKKCWQQDEFTCKCQLEFEHILSYKEVKELKQNCNDYGLEPILRSIECQFDGYSILKV